MRKVSIPEGCTNIVIFIHGFGVRWDSRGMFTDMVNHLPDRWGSVLFDLYETVGNDVYITTVDQQVERVQAIVREVRDSSPRATIHIIAHSKGCIIACKAKIEIIGKVILLTPPETIGRQLEDYLSQYPGSQRLADKLTIPRRDGTVTHIPVSFFTQTAKLNPQSLVLKYAEDRIIYLVQTTEDEVIGETTYSKLQDNKNIHITQLASDHNFTGKNREGLIKTVNKILTS